MSPEFDALQKLLLSADPDYNALHATLFEVQQSLLGVELARARSVSRLALALRDYAEKRAGAADITVLVRQVIRSYGARLRVPLHLWKSLTTDGRQAGLRVVEEREDGTILLVADDWSPTWLSSASSIDVLGPRRFDELAAGNSALYAMAGFLSYQSEAQKAAITSCFFAPPGSTTLVTLPTSAGKSFCSLLPAWFDSGGGRLKGGTTLVVVPTVSLALDQAQQAERRFAGALNSKYSSHALTSATSREERADIREGVSNGTLPILYTSPEAIIHSELYDLCLEAAASGNLKRLVVDEAHLVQSWGAGFRTEFQFLATYRKKLLERSGGQLRTILLSATVSRECDDLLESLFSEPGNFNRIRGNRLRPEPSYWFDWAASPEIRQQRVIEALRNLPRPAILYVTQPLDAKNWRTALRQGHFRRLAVFTGETPTAQRDHLVRAWNANEIDIMIATSAFGLGVDKPDVRTIVHACLPESADRFYQEVGRSGRDGCSSTSLLCAAPGDDDLARGMTRSALIKSDKALDRWRGMQRTALFSANRGDELAIDANAAPFSKPDMQPSELNQEWNEHTLLLMQRAKLLEVLTTRDDNWAQNETGDRERSRESPKASEVGKSDGTSQAEERMKLGRLLVRLLRPDIIARHDRLEGAIEAARAAERSEISQTTQTLLHLVRLYSSDRPRQCLAYQFAGIYPGAALACGGCSYCRAASISPYAQPIPVDITIEAALKGRDDLQPNLVRALGGHRMWNVFWEGRRGTDRLKEMAPDLASFVTAGVRQVILPVEFLRDINWVSALITRLSETRPLPMYVVLSDEQLDDKSGQPVVGMPTLVLYPPSDADADYFHRRLQPYLTDQLRWQTIINIVHHALFLESKQGRFLDRVDGPAYSVGNLRALFEQAEEVVLL